MNKEKEWCNVVSLKRKLVFQVRQSDIYKQSWTSFKCKQEGKRVFYRYGIHSDYVRNSKTLQERKTIQQVNDTLVERAIPMTITISEGEQKMSVHVGEALQDLKKGMDEQNKIIHSLVEQMKKQQEYIDKKLEARDQKLIETLKESMEARKQIASSKEDQRKRKASGQGYLENKNKITRRYSPP